MKKNMVLIKHEVCKAAKSLDEPKQTEKHFKIGVQMFKNKHMHAVSLLLKIICAQCIFLSLTLFARAIFLY